MNQGTALQQINIQGYYVQVNLIGGYVINNNHNISAAGGHINNNNFNNNAVGQTYLLENPPQVPPPPLEKFEDASGSTLGFRTCIRFFIDVLDIINYICAAATVVVNNDLLSQYPEKCPPGGADSVVLYTASLPGCKALELNCQRVRNILHKHGVAFHERSVSLHKEFWQELSMLIRGMTPTFLVPQLFVKGKHIGGASDVFALENSDQLCVILCSSRVATVSSGPVINSYPPIDHPTTLPLGAPTSMVSPIYDTRSLPYTFSGSTSIGGAPHGF